MYQTTREPFLNERKTPEVTNNESTINNDQHNETLDDIEALINLEESKYQNQGDQQQQQQTDNLYANILLDKSHAVKEQQFQYGGYGNPVNNNNNIVKQQVNHSSINPSTYNNKMVNESGMQMSTNTKLMTPSKSLVSRPYVKIIEQPARCSLRFRYECEGRSAGSLPGANSTTDNKTYPTIQVMNYVGKAVVVVSCVTKDYPFRPHPHNIVGKEGCKKGICTIVMNNNSDMICSFTSLGVQCVKKRDIEESLNLRETIQVDPFRTGFAHKQRISNIDLNVVRLCFQVFIEGPDGKTCTVPLAPVVSEPIHDKKAMSDLVITKLSHCSAPATGGREVILLCDRISKDDIQIRFYEEVNGKLLWEQYSEFQPNDVHKQAAICFRTPKYHTENIQHPVMVRVQLKRPSDNQVSEPRLFQFLPCENDEDIVARKRQKIEKIDLNNYVRENILQPHQQYQQQHQQMPYSHHFQQAQIIPSHLQQQQHYPQQQQQHLTNQALISNHDQLLNASTSMSQQVNLTADTAGGLDGRKIYTNKATFANYQLNQQTNSQDVASPSLSPNLLAIKAPGSGTHNQQAYNYHQQRNVQNDNCSRQNTPSPNLLGHHHHQARFQDTPDGSRPGVDTSYSTNTASYYVNNQRLNVPTDNHSPAPIASNSISPQFSSTPVPDQQHSPNANVRMDLQRLDNLTSAAEGDAAAQCLRKQINHYEVQQQQHKPPLSNRVVVKHEIIDDDGKIMQIVERSPRPMSDDRPQHASRNNTPDTNALSTRLDSLGLDGLDTTLMKEIAFNSTLMLNLDSNLSFNLTSNSGIGTNNSNSNTNPRFTSVVDSATNASTSDNNNAQNNQLDHTLNTPQVSELDPQPVVDNNILQQLDDSSTIR